MRNNSSMQHQASPLIYVLWDDSHMWGLLLLRALKHLKAPFRLVRGRDIARGALSRKPGALMVPGGNAKSKYEHLGEAGAEEIRRYVHEGGAYIGFCGGSGLGLSGATGLGLCPWQRKAFADRMQHFVSGHMLVKMDGDGDLLPSKTMEEPMLPVWWPARFNPEPDPGVKILARYKAPGPDFWLADMPLAGFPENALDEFETRYGFSMRPRFMEDQPVVVEGRFGKGRYVLSYSHLETPDSPHANAWLAYILEQLTGIAFSSEASIPAWKPHEIPAPEAGTLLGTTRRIVDEIIALGFEHFQLFPRNDWLYGWRRGIPGSSLNALSLLICEAGRLTPTPAAEAFLAKHKERMPTVLEHFRDGLTNYLPAERLAMTVPLAVPAEALKARRDALFGPPMAPGGLYGEIFHMLDEYVCLCLTKEDE
jgi:hypothetical protein